MPEHLRADLVRPVEPVHGYHPAPQDPLGHVLGTERYGPGHGAAALLDVEHGGGLVRGSLDLSHHADIRNVHE